MFLASEYPFLQPRLVNFIDTIMYFAPPGLPSERRLSLVKTFGTGIIRESLSDENLLLHIYNHYPTSMCFYIHSLYKLSSQEQISQPSKSLSQSNRADSKRWPPLFMDKKKKTPLLQQETEELDGHQAHSWVWIIMSPSPEINTLTRWFCSAIAWRPSTAAFLLADWAWRRW